MRFSYAALDTIRNKKENKAKNREKRQKKNFATLPLPIKSVTHLNY